MKKIKKMICTILVFSMIMGVGAVSGMPVYAKGKTAKTSKATHLFPEEYDDEAVKVQFVSNGDRITNLKTNSKNLSAKVTQIEDDSKSGSNKACIGLLAIKKGIYKVTFDIRDSDGKKISSHTVKVYVNKDYPIKKVTFDGKVMRRMITEKKSGKISVSMKKGYTLKEIHIRTFDGNGKQKVIRVKNNSEITLGIYPRYYKEQEYENRYSLNTGILAPTEIIISYKDKFTKEVEKRTYLLERVVE